MLPEGMVPFNFHIPVEKSYDSADGRCWVVEGPLSSPTEDLEGDVMSSSGLLKGMETFHRLKAPVDWDHFYAKYGEPKWLIGKGTETFVAAHPRTGHDVPWLRTELFKKKDVAQQAINHLDAGGDLGYSVYGGVLRRDGKVIKEPVITMVALTPTPVVAENSGCVRLAKSLAGAGVAEARPLPRAIICAPELWNQDLAALNLGRLRKALEASGVLPKAGPGVDAAGVEDFAGGTSPRRRGNKKRKRLAAAWAGALAALLRKEEQNGKER